MLTSYEAGAKVEIFDRRLRINTAAFHSRYPDIQLTQYDQGAPVNRHAGSAEINGAEVEITAAFIDNLQLSDDFGYLNDWPRIWTMERDREVWAELQG